MQLFGEIKLYNPTRRCGYIQVDGHPDILFYLKDLPIGYIAPRVGEKLQFILYEQDGKRFADDIVRLDVIAESGIKAKIKNLKHRSLVYFYAQTPNKQKQIILALVAMVLVSLATIFYIGHRIYQNAQAEKAKQFLLEQQRLIEQQRTALGDLPEQILSEQGRRNITGEVYGAVSDRSEMNTMRIDRLNGQLPVNMGKFRCDGRTQCTEMRSYEEALFFHRNCRGTQLDRNGNGKPCENDTRWLNR